MPRADEPDLVRDLDLRAAPAARDGAARERQVDPRRSPRRRARARRRCSPTAADSSRRIRSTSSRSAPAASDWRLLSSTTSNGSTNSVWPESEESWTMPGTLLRELALTASTGRPPRWVTKSSCRCSRSRVLRTSCSSFSVTRCRPVRSSTRSLRSRGEALSRRSEPSSSTARSIDSASGARAGSIAAASSRAAAPPARRAPRGAQRSADRVGDVAQRRGVEHAAARRVRGRLADVADPLERRLLGFVEERDRLGRQRLAAGDLVRIGRGRERVRELRAVRGRGRLARSARRSPGTRARRGRTDPRHECRLARAGRQAAERRLAP